MGTVFLCGRFVIRDEATKFIKKSIPKICNLKPFCTYLVLNQPIHKLFLSERETFLRSLYFVSV